MIVLHKQRPTLGFTLIELIVVILVLGILAATALPRFLDVQRDARVAKAQSVFGAIRSAAQLARARCELDLNQNLTGAGQCGNGTPQVTMDGTVVDIVNRYPIGAASGILAATHLSAAEDGLTISTAGGAFLLSVTGATDSNTCRISYTAAVAGAAPAITLVTTGC